MADQRVDVRNVRAGGSVTIAPQQNTYGAQGVGVRGWTEALVRGPLRRLGLEERVAEGEKALESGAHGEAAAIFNEVASALRREEYESAADEYLERSAAALVGGSDHSRAYQIYARLARSAVGDGELTALFKARRARELALQDLIWEADGLIARAGWPEQTAEDEPALRRAWEKSKGAAIEAEWGAALVELLLLNEKASAALGVAREVRTRVSLEAGPRLDLELDYLDLREEEDGAAATEDDWRVAIDWASDLRAQSVCVTARVWQRRGVALARREDIDGARRAFVQAVEAWGREPGFEDQMGEAYFSSLSAAHLLGDHSALFDDARPLAATLRGTKPSATTQVERLERRGLRRLLEGKYPDAFRAFATAHNHARRAGNLSDFLQITEELGDALAAAEHPMNALSAYVAAGEVKKTKKIVKGITADAALEAVELDSPRWQRTAAWAAVAGTGRLISDRTAGDLIPRALREIEREPPTQFFTNASYYAADVLANAVCASPADQLGRVLALLRERLLANAGDPKRLAKPLILVTLGGLSDETEVLVTAFLADDVYASIEPHLISDLIASRETPRERIVDAAKNGNGPAFDALVFGDLIGDDEELLRRANERLTALSAAPNREVITNGGTQTVTVGLGRSYAVEGLLARACPKELARAR